MHLMDLGISLAFTDLFNLIQQTYNRIIIHEFHSCHVRGKVVAIIILETRIKVHCVYRSGGHFNPVVSLSVCLCGGMKFLLLAPYIVTQMIGGMIGAGLAKV